MKKLIIILLSFLLISCSGNKHIDHTPEVTPVIQIQGTAPAKPVLTEMEWLQFEVALFDRAGEEGKIVLLYIYSDDNPTSDRMDETFENKKVIAIASKNFLSTKVNATKYPSIMDLIFKEEKVVPAYLFLKPTVGDANGYHSELVGYFPPEIFTIIMQEVADKFNEKSAVVDEPQSVFAK